MFLGKKPLVLTKERPTWCHLLFYFTYYVFNMFRTLIYPSSGACDCVDDLPHRSSYSQFVVCWSFGCCSYLVVFVLQAVDRYSKIDTAYQLSRLRILTSTLRVKISSSNCCNCHHHNWSNSTKSTKHTTVRIQSFCPTRTHSQVPLI